MSKNQALKSEQVLTPENEAQAADMIGEAHRAGTKLALMGNGSKARIGNDVIADAALSSAKMSGIISYDPAELVMVAKSGTPMSEINKALAKGKQMHAFEPANWTALLGVQKDQTIGGIAATNMSGSRRMTAGAARDSLLGVRFINGRGEAIKNGGQVMKNVTGLDLVKLMAGSWGTLGFLTEVSFKVLPQPETEITLAIRNQTDEAAAKRMARALSTSADVTGAAHMPGIDGATYLRLEGIKETIAPRRDRLVAALGNGLKIEEMDASASSMLWASMRDVTPFADGSPKPVWRISVAPMAGHQVVAEILSKVDGHAFYDWQGGLVWLCLDDETNAHAVLVRSAIIANGGGHATLIRASDEVRAATPVFQPEIPAVAALSARIKAAMDPDGLFNIGRMVPDFTNSAA